MVGMGWTSVTIRCCDWSVFDIAALQAFLEPKPKVQRQSWVDEATLAPAFY